MAFEIYGFTIGDLAAIGALIASPLIFWFGYSRTRKSEQIKIARDIVDRIELKLQEVRKFAADNSLLHPLTNASLEKRLEQIYPYQNHLTNLLSEIGYFSHLVEQKEIEDKILIDYYQPIVSSKLEVVADFCSRIRSWLEDEKVLGQSPHDRKILMEKTEIQEAKVKRFRTTWRISKENV